MLPASHNTTPSRTVVLTERQFVKLYSAAWAMGYAIAPSLPIEIDVVRACRNDIVDVLMEVEAGDIAAMMQRVGEW